MLKLKNNFMKGILLCTFAILISSSVFAEDKVSDAHSANISWLLISSALVLFMVPGLGFFYGGMVRQKNILNTLMLSFVALGIITVQWILIGYSLAFGPDIGKIIGDVKYIFLNGVSADFLKADTKIPHLLFMVFQGMFAVITPALISGAVVERIKFSAYILFIVIWATLIYDPICHWVWGGGWINTLASGAGKTEGAIDFAGGIVVHISSGISALAIALVLGKRKGYPNEVILPNNLNFTLLGAGLLWFGWFGFNAGSALASDSNATLAFVCSFVSPAGGSIAWALAEKFHRGKASALGFASGIIAGLGAITPSAAYVTPQWALVIGFLAGFICYGAVLLKNKFGYDDSLDVFGVHGVGGIWGVLAAGIFATQGRRTGLITGNFDQFTAQVIAILATVAYSFILTFIIAKVLDLAIGLRVSENEEIEGLDQSQHGEVGYNL